MRGAILLFLTAAAWSAPVSHLAIRVNDCPACQLSAFDSISLVNAALMPVVVAVPEEPVTLSRVEELSMSCLAVTGCLRPESTFDLIVPPGADLSSSLFLPERTQ